jgi:HSP20 family protein
MEKNMRRLIPWSRGNAIPATYEEPMSPFLTLHREMNRLFDDAFRSFDVPSVFGSQHSWPKIEVSEGETETRITAELPGMDEKDVEILLADGVVTIRGEKKSEVEDKDRQFSERFYGRFERRIPVGGDVDQEQVTASFKNGVLSVAVPRPASAQARAKRIPINGRRH